MLKIVIFSTLLFFAFANKSEATESDTVFTNKTFAVSGKLDRFYFKKNKKFSYQFAHSSGDYLPGDILKGEWSYNNGILCLNYDSIPTQFCFDHIFENDRHILADNGTVHFYLDDWRDGNWLLTLDGIDHLLRARHYKKESIDPEFDQNIVNFLQEKVAHGFIEGKSFLFSPDGNIFEISGNNQRNKTGYIWSVENGKLFIDNVDDETSLIFVMTFGEEFIELKDTEVSPYQDLYFPIDPKEKNIQFIEYNAK